ncbi:MAG: hypothetical protein KAT37_01925 [Candidatus Aenigmarchaeota archaeon]|nr:hypothetical protein [Candidatus Aenigmarchaeota archaeon]
MPKCKNCGKKISFLSLSDFSGNYFCNDICKNEFKNKKIQEKKRIERGLKGTSELMKKSKEMKERGMIEEIKCKCNQCGHVWHYLKSDEKILHRQATSNALIGAGMCCNPFGALFSNKSLDLQREVDKMKKCPKCNSVDVKRTTIYHEKKF